MDNIIVGDLVIWPDVPRLKVCGREVRLTVRQWELFMALAHCAGHLVTRRMLQAVMQRNAPRGIKWRGIDIAICRLRGILAANASGRNFIASVPSEGYVLQDPGMFEYIEQPIQQLAA